MSVVFVQFTWNIYICNVLHEMLYMPRAKWSERPKPKPSEAKAKSQKPKAKWARKWEILAPKCMQNRDFSSKMQQIGSKLPQAEKQKQLKKTHPKHTLPWKDEGCGYEKCNKNHIQTRWTCRTQPPLKRTPPKKLCKQKIITYKYDPLWLINDQWWMIVWCTCTAHVLHHGHQLSLGQHLRILFFKNDPYRISGYSPKLQAELFCDATTAFLWNQQHVPALGTKTECQRHQWLKITSWTHVAKCAFHFFQVAPAKGGRKSELNKALSFSFSFTWHWAEQLQN